MRVLVLIALFFATPLTACLWDYDTLAQESAGMPDVKVVIVGGFARNPALYYEMRLARVTQLLAESPNDLDAYDAAGVACDRLGRSDEAIEWMAQKLAAMDRMGYVETAQPNHRYRYLANLGTFHAHRWFKAGAKRDDLRDLETARDLVTSAIKENPDAHFGREKYQLRFVEWMLSDPKYFNDDDKAKAAGQRAGWKPNVLDLGKDANMRVATGDNTHLQEMGLSDAIEGICGLITMGAAWESIDAFHVLALLLQIDGKSAFAYFAMLRVQELVAEERRSIVAGLPPEALTPDNLSWLSYVPSNDQRATKAEYSELRSQAVAWHDSRTAYMLERLGQGKHPDTDDNFWDDFDGDPEYVDVPSGFIYAAGGFWRGVFISPFKYPVAIFLFGTAIMVGVFLVSRRIAKKRKHRLAR